MSEELYKKALTKSREYRGEGSKLGGGPLSKLAPEVDRLKDELLWGVLWSNPAVDLKTRSLCTISALMVLGIEEQFRHHVKWALNIGVTKEQIVSIITQMMFYGGIARAQMAIKVANEIFTDTK